MAVSHSLPVALHCVPVPGLGGVARHISDIAEAGLPGYRLVVLCPPGALSARLKELGAEVLEANFGTDAGLMVSLRTLTSIIENLQPAIVHSHLAYADVVAAIAVNRLKARRVLHRSTHLPQLFTTEHGIAGDDTVYHGSFWRSRLMQTVHRARLWGTDGALAVSQSTADQMRRQWGARKVGVLTNGIDLLGITQAVASHRVVPASHQLRVLSLSRLAPEKGLDVLIDAFSLLQQQVPGASLEIAGEGELLPQLQQQVKKLGLEESVSFPGFVDSLAAMGRSDVLVQLSVWENCSYTLLDAKAAGLKVIATAVGGNLEILSGADMVPSLRQMNRHIAAALVAKKVREAQDLPNTTFEWTTTEQMTSRLADYYGEGQDVYHRNKR